MKALKRQYKHTRMLRKGARPSQPEPGITQHRAYFFTIWAHRLKDSSVMRERLAILAQQLRGIGHRIHNGRGRKALIITMTNCLAPALANSRNIICAASVAAWSHHKRGASKAKAHCLYNGHGGRKSLALAMIHCPTFPRPKESPRGVLFIRPPLRRAFKVG